MVQEDVGLTTVNQGAGRCWFNYRKPALGRSRLETQMSGWNKFVCLYKTVVVYKSRVLES